MTIIDKKLPWELFPITTSSLLKLANHAMHGSETVKQCLRQAHQAAIKGLCCGLRECHDTHNVKIVCESCTISHPYLVSFPFYTIPICLLFKIRRIFYLLVIP